MKTPLTCLVVTCREDCSECEPLAGGDPTSPSWEVYRNGWKDPERADAVRQAVIDAGLDRSCGDQHANRTHFRFSDGLCIGLTWRAWGDLIQAIEDKREGYMRYYMQ